MADWLNNAIFYEVYPQSFRDSDGDGIGDFRGIISKLEYIRNLGCNAIWINPCFDSSFYDAGYDVRDYYTVAARYGSNEDLAAVFEHAHELGMHVLLIWCRVIRPSTTPGSRNPARTNATHGPTATSGGR